MAYSNPLGNASSKIATLPKWLGAGQNVFMGTSPKKSDKNNPQAEALRMIMTAEFGNERGAQTAMAKATYVSVKAFNNWLSGYKIPDWYIDRLCDKWPYLKPEFIKKREVDRMTPEAMMHLGIIKSPIKSARIQSSFVIPPSMSRLKTK